MHEPQRIELALTPTPLIAPSRLRESIGRDDLWVKRDDLTGLELSGNKIRKLEYVLADAIATGCDTIVTEGTCQSNHCRATAAACARLGLRCVLLFRPAPPTTMQGNHLLDTLCGAETRSYDRPAFDQNRTAIVNDVLAELRGAGARPRWTPAGASEPLGCWGYIRAAAELGAQLSSAGIEACDVVVAVSSGGTYAGLLLGKWLHQLTNVRLIAIPVSDDIAWHRTNTEALCTRAIEQFELPITFRPEDMHFEDGFVGEGYAIPYDGANETVRMLMRTEALLLDPVYTAKAFYGMLTRIAEHRLGQDRPIVFMHTGGFFSNFAWPERLLGA